MKDSTKMPEPVAKFDGSAADCAFYRHNRKSRRQLPLDGASSERPGPEELERARQRHQEKQLDRVAEFAVQDVLEQ